MFTADSRSTKRNMAWHRYTLVVIGLTASLCIQKGKSDGNSTGNSTGQTPARAVCETPRCLSAANGMIKKMKLSANPCEDFNEFACGRFIEESEISEGGVEVSPFTIIQHDNQATLHAILLGKVKATDPQYLINMKRFYNSCMDEETIEAVGLTPYLNEREFVDDWPTLNPSWSGANFDLNEVIARYSKVFIKSILDTYVMKDYADSNKVVISLDEATLTLGQENYNKPRNDTILQAYEKYLVDIAVALNASREVAEQDAEEVVDLEIELAKIMVPRAKKRDTTMQNNPVQLNQLSTMYPELDIAGFVRAIFGLINITLTGDEKVLNRFPTYIGNVSQVVQKFSNRTLQNLFGFNFAQKRVGELTRRMRQITQDFKVVLEGRKAMIPRWKFCVTETSTLFWKGISKQFVTRLFSERAKRDVNDMIGNIKPVFRDVIEDTTWMSNATKTEALEKLAAMKQKVGYPDVDFNEADIEEKYRNHIMKEDYYYNNVVLCNKLNTLELLQAYGKPVDKKKWEMFPFHINAYFSNPHNEIAILAGIMQRPIYSETFPDYMNYGAIGSIIGHEITHGFDDKGKHYDGNGTMRDWWTPEDSQNFANKKQCIIDQNSNTHVHEVNMNLNGLLTQGESIGDFGGIKIAFRAYKNHVRKSGQQPRLPGLDLSQDQLFFVSFAQMHCAKFTPERLTYRVLSLGHPPGKYRLRGVLRNTEDFARVYHCPEGSFMNPTDKCNVWQPSDLLKPRPLRSHGNRRISFALGLTFLHFTMLTCYMNLVRVLTF